MSASRCRHADRGGHTWTQDLRDDGTALIRHHWRCRDCGAHVVRDVTVDARQAGDLEDLRDCPVLASGPLREVSPRG